MFQNGQQSSARAGNRGHRRSGEPLTRGQTVQSHRWRHGVLYHRASRAVTASLWSGRRRHSDTRDADATVTTARPSRTLRGGLSLKVGLSGSTGQCPSCVRIKQRDPRPKSKKKNRRADVFARTSWTVQAPGSKGVGTTPKVRGPTSLKLRSHLEQKRTPLRCNSTQIRALLVLMDHFLYKNCVYDRSERF